MAELLDSNQVMLLNNLMYLNSSEGPFQSITDCKDMNVGDYAAQQLNELSRLESSGKTLTDQQLRYKSVLQAVKNDSNLSGMVVAGTKTESSADGGGSSAMFVNPQSKEAVVAYRGTGIEEWKDNFQGGAKTDQPDGVSTKYQEAALKTYQEYRDQVGEGYTMTVTGHSKGGNKAKYITLLDDSVDRCLSYDGQGFSDDFMGHYKDQIMKNQGKIANHNVDDDFVNLLLNDVGTTTFYANNKGKDNLANNHYPDAYFKFGENGEYSTQEVPRSKETAELDAFLNSALRSMDPDNRKNTMEMFGDLASYVFHQSRDGKNISMNDLRDILFSGSNLDSAAYFIAYLAKYETEHPEFGQAISSYLERNGMGEMNKFIQGADDILNSWWFEKIIKYSNFLHGAVSGLWSILPGSLKDQIRSWIRENLGVNLSDEEIARLIDALFRAAQYYKDIDVLPDGADISYESVSDRLYVEFDYLEEVISQLRSLSAELENLQSQCHSISVDSAMEDIRFEVPLIFSFFIKRFLGGSHSLSVAAMLDKMSNAISACSQYADSLAQAVQSASNLFMQNESGIASDMDF